MLAAVVVVLLWDRDRKTALALLFPGGWALAAVLTLAWPILVLGRYPEAWRVWMVHVADRLGGTSRHFAGESWLEYGLSPFWQTLPWMPLALGGAWRSWRRARGEPRGGDRLLWAWAVAPAVLVSLASVRNAHYLIHALPPWSIWGALALVRLGERLRGRGWSPGRLRRTTAGVFAVLGLSYALGFALLGPRFDRRGVEWAWYASASRSLEDDEPLALLYDDWDRDPYATPFGALPHDLAVRLFYLDRPACWRDGVAALRARPPGPGPFAVIGRPRDLPALRRLGRVETLAHGPRVREDRTYLLLRITPDTERVARRFPD